MKLTHEERSLCIEALKKHAKHPVTLETDVVTVSMFIGALHLAMRHPAFPDLSRIVIEEWMQEFTHECIKLDPIFEIFFAAGADPANDE